ncbi:2,5-diamino-6-(ribosylamino)-4(3H)-pyrimidinone 5'-phosphate reductase [Methanohalophilus portucalensis]|uniref:2,5-diamino-6-(ribosylamino)-4(3H)-pyrimidinone 5'-phosphate reductase n=2 Tax=Methanohalophilus portucalensis TaxID=39664 RepID=A0A1L9C4W4_9EURY|nr:2,5-diamino-6-(ribosylamino)-4(3H)-pyrimidinone 5'-phosphate reductase [Methanohalophilus portucalensis]ATU07744.1 diaminohydroxyphosphoribosylaminopyrimidine reductase [Methanohalophilus portucalensis]OJH49448.1 2,5-diamino-6-(5-phosphoribosylamino)pyrimidin-4(3H)-one reductase [Methanohalophilus portucalensis FDF-1]RNI11457.1 2,5-diamino-6-(ribosylamino)-4(3H)-pyrimidinone 5'-phosphate reductase [Methanohalophilus portucalensis FDF-1]SMH40900.1 2,5-diamino-6-(5-phosphoribosylamino)pyrimidi
MPTPFTYINAAMSIDGKISTRQRCQVRISGDVDFERMDELRASSDAVMVGIGTVLADDPSLTVKSDEKRAKRLAKGLDENPVRIVVDSKARIPTDADILRKGAGKIIIAVSESAAFDRVESLRKKAMVIMTGGDQVDLPELLSVLDEMGIKSLMVEGGAGLNWGLVKNGLVEEIYSFIGNLIIGGSNAPTLIDGDGFDEADMPTCSLISAEKMEDGVLLKWKLKNS